MWQTVQLLVGLLELAQAAARYHLRVAIVDEVNQYLVDSTPSHITLIIKLDQAGDTLP